MTILAVSISAESVEKAQEQIDRSVCQGAEAIELRLDFLENPEEAAAANLVKYVKAKGLPVIATCRHISEGGSADWPTEKRLKVLTAAMEAGADFIDWEFAQYLQPGVQEMLTAALRRFRTCRLILSAHDFHGPFEDLSARYEAMRTLCPEAVVKLVYTAGHINDCFEAMDLLYQEKEDLIVFAMGPAGMITRILAKKLGGFLTFACPEEAAAAAPGQIPVRKMKTLYRWDALNRQTELYGIIGNPVGHSLSPAVYNGCFDAQGRNALHLPLEVGGGQAEFNLFLQSVLQRPWLDFRGFGVTLPHKSSALEFVHQEGGYLEPLAERIGAANTVKIGHNGQVSAYNTDCVGALNALTETLGVERKELRNQEAAVIGAGGAARAVIVGLMDAGCRVTVYNRTLEKAQSLAEEFGCRAAPLEEIRSCRARIFINCTSLGMAPNTDSTPVPAEVFGPNSVAFDTVYVPLETRFLREAKAAGARVVSGAEMFIRQAVVQYRHLTGVEPDELLLRRIVMEKLK
ncbi:MAG TPA: shikimate dehydrogenase [Anaerohalosphaeraceae bacterium]|nr:shikimate dehydrogenase [Anaerohalosphaeraceae bacterium]HOL89440.1 shikimate dehydrogenase [Anaerohalosphaeraceae bacterium]HPP56730.1 shikimate dehydrogenase [Anaerohalosphaeraceae bacterium]